MGITFIGKKYLICTSKCIDFADTFSHILDLIYMRFPVRFMNELWYSGDPSGLWASHLKMLCRLNILIVYSRLMI